MKNLEEYDVCVSCGKPTVYKQTDNIVYRYGYIEGAGQCCLDCSQIKKKHTIGNYENVDDSI
jgi:NAD(P)H-flavin reductase